MKSFFESGKLVAIAIFWSLCLSPLQADENAGTQALCERYGNDQFGKPICVTNFARFEVVEGFDPVCFAYRDFINDFKMTHGGSNRWLAARVKFGQDFGSEPYYKINHVGKNVSERLRLGSEEHAAFISGLETEVKSKLGTSLPGMQLLEYRRDLDDDGTDEHLVMDYRYEGGRLRSVILIYDEHEARLDLERMRKILWPIYGNDVAAASKARYPMLDARSAFETVSDFSWLFESEENLYFDIVTVAKGGTAPLPPITENRGIYVYSIKKGGAEKQCFLTSSDAK